ncbi:fructosamine kinase family protein [Spirochaeta cellobiosiphila]|uniref:fructosamine kinase family protein n=1 Tax=Spirochaeta cellobiosiphila TaxID=504483 RepID=UPI00040918F5|nr:fructosamine kinase family protein [Spirochaeta cellobiosiphila]
MSSDIVSTLKMLLDTEENPHIRALSGGDINHVYHCIFPAREYLLKVNTNHYPHMFIEEAKGLSALEQTYKLPIPHVIKHYESETRQYLLMEYVPTGRKSSTFSSTFGRLLAESHQEGNFQDWGFDSNNYIGSTPQINNVEVSWPQFFAIHRLQYQRDLAISHNKLPPSVDHKLLRVIIHINNYLFEPEQKSLLHGDLWGGNYLVNTEGLAVLIDPAVYVGHYEADIAMTELFGGFDTEFYKAYKDVLPLDKDYYRIRRPVYQLYHMLNHLNIFGGSYLSSCDGLLTQILA